MDGWKIKRDGVSAIEQSLQARCFLCAALAQCNSATRDRIRSDSIGISDLRRERNLLDPIEAVSKKARRD